MVINRNNLSIATHCGTKPVQGHPVDNLYVDENKTFAVNGVYAVAVSSLSKGNAIGTITPEHAERITKDGEINIGRADMQPLVGNIPPIDRLLYPNKPVLFEMKINLKYLQGIINSVTDADGKLLRLRFTGAKDPVLIDSRSVSTGQKIEAVLMGLDPENEPANARFEAPAPPLPESMRSNDPHGGFPGPRSVNTLTMSDFDRAMLDAARLAGE